MSGICVYFLLFRNFISILSAYPFDTDCAMFIFKLRSKTISATSYMNLNSNENRNVYEHLPPLVRAFFVVFKMKRTAMLDEAIAMIKFMVWLWRVYLEAAKSVFLCFGTYSILFLFLDQESKFFRWLIALFPLMALIPVRTTHYP